MDQRTEYVLEIVVSRKKITEKLKQIDDLFQMKYEISRLTWISVIKYEFYGPIGNERIEALKRMQEGQYPIVESYFVGKVSAIR